MWRSLVTVDHNSDIYISQVKKKLAATLSKTKFRESSIVAIAAKPEDDKPIGILRQINEE